jgi:hypothetical protein
LPLIASNLNAGRAMVRASGTGTLLLDKESKMTDGFFDDLKRDDDPARRDRPLTGSWKLKIDFGSKPAKGRRQEQQDEATAILFGELSIAHRAGPKRWVSYSRRREFYSARSRYQPGAITFATVTGFVRTNVELGNIEHVVSSPRRRGTQSKMRLTEMTALGFSSQGAKLVYDPPELIILRDRDGKLVDYADNDEVRRIRRNLSSINEAVAAAKLAYRGQTIEPGDLIYSGDKQIICRNVMHRVFNRRSFKLGGRSYGPWWQNIKAEDREVIQINGCRTVELDYRQLHPNLLYAKAGQSLIGDAYDIDGWPRKLVKQATNTLINADDELSARRSIARSIGGKGAFEKASRLIALIRAKHAAISEYFGTGAGLRLMRIDSDMAESVQLALNRAGIVSLPVHDSFIVQADHAGALEQAMDDALQSTLLKLRGSGLSAVRYSQSVPQYGDRPSLLVGQSIQAGSMEPDNDNSLRVVSDGSAASFDLPADGASKDRAA